MMGRPSAARVRGPLQPFASGFMVELEEQGYSWAPIGARLRLMAELSGWLAMRDQQSGALTSSLVEQFLASARASGAGQQWCSPTSARQLLGYLRAVGLVPPVAAAVVSDPVERLVARFVEYLLRERGLVAGSSTVYEYQRTARLFLVGRVDCDVGVERVTAGQVTGFVLAECRRRSVRMSALRPAQRPTIVFLCAARPRHTGAPMTRITPNPRHARPGGVKGHHDVSDWPGSSRRDDPRTCTPSWGLTYVRVP